MEEKVRVLKLESPEGLSPEEIKEKSTALKDEGNKLFGDKSYEESIVKYTEAIGVDPKNVPFHLFSIFSTVIEQLLT